MSMTNAAVLARFFPPDGPPPPLWLVDVGVGRGREAWELSELWPGLKVVGLEPSPVLHAAALAAGYPGKLLPWGAWSHAREAQLSRDGETSSLYCHNRGRVEWEDVTVRPLDELRGLVGDVPRSVVLWADVEGAELEVLRGAWELLRSGVVAVLNLEVRPVPRFPGACCEADVDSFLAAFGYAKALVHSCHSGGDPHADAVYVPTSLARCW